MKLLKFSLVLFVLFIANPAISMISDELNTVQNEFEFINEFGMFHQNSNLFADSIIFREGDNLFDEKNVLLESEFTKPQPIIIQFTEEPLAQQDSFSIQSATASIQQQHEIAKRDISQILSSGEFAIQSESEFKPKAEWFTILNGIAIDANQEQIKQIRNLPYVKSVELDGEVHILLNESVPIINAEDVWLLNDPNGNNLTGTGIKIAIIDTGVDYHHPDLGNCTNTSFLAGTCDKVAGGYDFVNNDADPMDDHGHGTHCAGIAAGDGNASNGLLKGVAPNATIYAYKVLNSAGSGSESNIISGIENATNAGADVLSISLGGDGDTSDSMSQAVDNAVDAGVVVVVAAGNSGPSSQTILSPGTARKALTIGASCKPNQIGEDSRCDEYIASFSSRGPVILSTELITKPEVVAPGVMICAAQWGTAWSSSECHESGEYTAISGTSMATPHVAGAAALLIQQYPNKTAEQIRDLIIQNGQAFENQTIHDQGVGQIDTFLNYNSTFIINNISNIISLGSYTANASENVTINITSISNNNQTLNLSIDFTTNATGNVSSENITIIANESQTFNISINSDSAGYHYSTLNISQTQIPLQFVISGENCGMTLTASTNLTEDITACVFSKIIIIDADDVTLDCQGHLLQGEESAGVYVNNQNNITVKNCNVSLNSPESSAHAIYYSTISGGVIDNNTVTSYSIGSSGVYLSSSSNISISNTFSNQNGYHGITIAGGSDNEIINVIVNSNEYDGIYFFETFNVSMINITANSNGYGSGSLGMSSGSFRGYGMYLFVSDYITMRNCSMSGNYNNFHTTAHSHNDIDTSNTVEGKPIYHAVGEQDAIIDVDESNYGFLMCIDCNNITVQNAANLSRNSLGVMLWNTNNSAIINVTANNNHLGGIFVDYCHNTTVENITVNYNGNAGVYVYYSPNTRVANIYITNSTFFNGITLFASNYSTLTNVTANNCTWNGLWSQYSSYNNLTNIFTANNLEAGLSISNGDGNIVENATITSNGASNYFSDVILSFTNNNLLSNIDINSSTRYALRLEYSINNSIFNSEIVSNDTAIFSRWNTSNNVFYNNLINAPTHFNVSGNVYVLFWNTSQQAGTRIYGSGNQIGGNYWTNSTGGYSDTCTDADTDGFCDESYNISDGSDSVDNVDYLVLSDEYVSDGVEVNSCGSITEDSILTADISNQNGNCFTIDADNITFDCQGNLIDGDDSGTDRGIHLNGKTNVTIKNCVLTDFQYGLWIQSSSSNNFTNITSNSNFQRGIYIYDNSNNNILTDIVTNSNNRGTQIHSSSNNTLTNIVANENYENGQFFSSGRGGRGIYLYSADNNQIVDASLDSNEYGLYLESSSNNEFNNITITDGGYGIYIYDSVQNNTIINSNVYRNYITTYNTNTTDFSNVSFKNNIRENMISISTLNETFALNDLVEFNVSIYLPNGTECTNCDWNVSTRPQYDLEISNSSNEITGNFTASRLGINSIVVNVTDEDDNFAEIRYLVYVNATKVKNVIYYFRSVFPTHGQPRSYADAYSLLTTAPTSEEIGWCGAWTQVSPNELPESPFGIIDDMNISIWYKIDNTLGTSELGVQRYVTYDKITDYNEPISNNSDYIFTQTNFSSLNWAMNNKNNWYWLSVKLNGSQPYWLSSPTNLSYINIYYLTTTTPEIKSISNNNVSLLSATSSPDNLTSAEITLGGAGSTDLVINMPNSSNYTVYLDGIECVTSNCTYVQSGTEVNISAELISEHNITINSNTTSDTTPPNITYITNQTIQNGQSLGVDFNATDDVAIDSWWVNDTTNFAISNSGYLTNATSLSVQLYNLNISVNDTSGNTASQVIWVNVTDGTPPAYVTNLSESTVGRYYITWNWTNPTDSDFNHTEVWLDSTFKTNTSSTSYNATSLIPNTEYTIQLRTVDTSGNINSTWVESTVRTLPIINETSWGAITANFAARIISTSIPTNLSFNYGETESLGNITTQDFAYYHPIRLYNLSAITTYYYNYTLCEQNNSCTSFGTYNFTTEPEIIQLPNTSNFNGTDFELENISAVPNASILIPNRGKIYFKNKILNFTNLNLNSYINISANKIEINAANLTVLNESAELTLYDLSYTNPRILMDGMLCPSSICEEINYSGGTFVFNVTHFTIYSSEETPTDDPDNDNNDGSSSRGGSITPTTVVNETNETLENTTVNETIIEGITNEDLRKTPDYVSEVINIIEQESSATKQKKGNTTFVILTIVSIIVAISILLVIKKHKLKKPTYKSKPIKQHNIFNIFKKSLYKKPAYKSKSTNFKSHKPDILKNIKERLSRKKPIDHKQRIRQNLKAIAKRHKLSLKNTDKLISYIAIALSRGYEFKQIKEHLIEEGWDTVVIEVAYDTINKELKEPHKIIEYARRYNPSQWLEKHIPKENKRRKKK